MLRVPPAGERRAVYLHPRPGATLEVAAYARERLRDVASAMLRDDAVELGLFGPGRLSERAAGRIGEVLLFPRGDLQLFAPLEHVKVFAVLAALVSLVSMVIPPLAGALSDRLRRRGVPRRAFILGGAAVDVACLVMMAEVGNLGLFAVFLLLATFGATEFSCAAKVKISWSRKSSVTLRPKRSACAIWSLSQSKRLRTPTSSNLSRLSCTTERCC